MKEIKAIMAGSVWKILAAVGDSIAEGQDVVILESMKMEIPITAEVQGVVREVCCAEGQFVDEGHTLLKVE